VDRIKRLSMEVLKENREKFTANFDENKNVLNNISIIRSKALRNRLAGYITTIIKKELMELEKTKNMEKQEDVVEDQIEPAEPVTKSISKETIMPETA
tara:strand:- start:346 stop:639 length:294 start_codon:yes stop_codon:yes gene_type:complete